MTSPAPPANIGPRGIRLRRVLGVSELITAAGVLVAVEWIGAGPGWRLMTFPFLWMGVLGVLQSNARTCVALAARRTCDAELGNLTEAEAEILARRGREILWRATIVAAAITLLTLLLPSRP